MSRQEKMQGWDKRVSYITAVKDHAEVDPDTGLYPPEVQDIIENFDWYVCEACVEREVADKCPPTPGIGGDEVDVYRKEKARHIRSRMWYEYWHSHPDQMDEYVIKMVKIMDDEKAKLGWK